MEAIFTREEQNELLAFVRTYESYNDEIKVLEEQIKSLLDSQEVIVKSITQTRKEEEDFFISLSERTTMHPSQLKILAKSFIIEKNDKNDKTINI